MQEPMGTTISKASTHRWGSGDCKTGKTTTNRFDRAKRLLDLDRLPQRVVLILLLVSVSSCAEPQLIENPKLDQGRIHDTVMRVSYASGLRVNRPLSVMLANRTELHRLLQKSAAATPRSDIRAAMQDGRSAMGFPSGVSSALDPSIGLLSRSATGLYIPKTETLYVISEAPQSEDGGIYLNSLGDLGNEVTLAHEVVHALQHQHYPDLFEPDEAVWQQQADANIALQAAVEGDANLWAAQSFGSNRLSAPRKR